MDPIESFIALASKISYKDISAETLESIKMVLVDFIGVMIGGTNSRPSRLCTEIVSQWGGPEEATVFANNRKVPIHAAVLANCTAGRALDYDDVHEQAHLHATVAVVPPALAISETTKVSGSEFIVSIVLGFELLARMGLALTKGPGATGMSTTYQGASLASALVGAKLLGFTPELTRNALGIAYSQMAGNQQVIREGVDLMVVQQGLSAMSGMIAVEMARIGLTGPKEIFSGRYGYFPVYHPQRYNTDAFTKDLGKSWEIKNTSLKPFPCCKLIHTALQAALDLRSENNLLAEEILEVRVGINIEDYDMICEPLEAKREPKTVVDAIYSVPYVLAVALVHGKIGLEDFTMKAIQRQEVLKISKIVKPVKDASLPKVTDTGIPAWVSIMLQNRKILECRRDVVKGSPSMPLSTEERYEKFFDCFNYAQYPRKIGEHLLESLEHIEDMEDVSDLVALISKRNDCY
ncbi:MAG: MmgE/PrpD family protein [Thermodesulfobacteriota bacterium]